ncbi:MAG: hypothetical protein ISS82_01240 [Nanoarchaeota archaeon]|nr:hypothetical protein [Nanoarchaeota archaeon]
MEERIELGGNINLVGFKDIEQGKLVVVKKIVGNFVKKIQDQNKDFQKVTVTLKPVHESKYEINTHLTINNKDYVADVTDFNLFFTLDKCLEKSFKQIQT